jgi:hypothetical protein
MNAMFLLETTPSIFPKLNVDAAGADDAQNLGVAESCVAALF